MNEKELYKKYYKDKRHDYELEETTSITDDTGRHPEILFIYSGRNRGKSYEAAMRCITEAYYHGRQFAYIRRHKATIKEVEDYFEDKHQLIKDMTDGEREGVTMRQGVLYLYTYSPDLKDGYKMILKEPIGRFFALSQAGKLRSTQYPDVWTMLYEEVLTDEEPFLRNEPNKLMNLFSTIGRDRKGFRMICISNTVSQINPYSKAWNLLFSRTKPNTVRLNKLFLGVAGEDGKERYYLIASHYLKDKGDLTPEDKKRNAKNRIKTGLASNVWDEARLYHNIDFRYMKMFKVIDTVLFEWDDVCFKCDIKKVPENVLDMYQYEEEPARSNIYIMYISRKTTEPKFKTRLYTNNPERLNALTTRGFRVVYKIDEVIEDITKRGWIIGTDNLCMNDFMKIYQNLRLIIK